MGGLWGRITRAPSCHGSACANIFERIGWQPTYRPLEGHYQPTQKRLWWGLGAAR